MHASHTEVRANRVDVRIVNKETIILLEMNCPYIENRRQKEEDKTLKYSPLRRELKKQNPDYKVDQLNNYYCYGRPGGGVGGYPTILSRIVRELL